MYLPAQFSKADVQLVLLAALFGIHTDIFCKRKQSDQLQHVKNVLQVYTPVCVCVIYGQ